MFPTFISILDIQSWWEVPSIAHFCSLFRAAFNLLDFDIEDLEEALLTDGTEETSWLQELIVRLLSGCLANNEISTFNYQMFLRRLFRQKCQEHDRYNPFNTDIDFQFLPLRTKVEILQALCDFRLDAEDVLDHLKNLEADSLRVEPLGHDDNESAYWYFYGTRLYREDFTFKNNKQVKSVWQVICFTEEDWYQLARKFRKSSSKIERQLYRTLSENFLPELPRLFQEKEVLHRKRLLEWLPRRTSSRLDIKRQQIKESESAEEVSQQDQENDNKKDSDLAEEQEDGTLKTRKKHKAGYEKGRKRKEPSEPAQTDTSSTEIRKRKLEEKRHAVEIADRRKQRELRSQNREKTKDKGAQKTTKENKAAASAPGATPVGRQTNNSLASATGQIVIQSVSNPNRKKLKTSQVFRQSAEDLQTGMYKILEAVKNHEDAWPFVEPVEEEYAPNYYTVIRRPMDLQRMEDKLDAGAYVSFGKFRQDFQLIVDNCRLYNGTDNEYTEMVDNIQQAFKRATDRYLDQITSSDEEIAVEFQDTSKDKTANAIQSKRKKGETTPNTTVSRRKPTSIAHTTDKRERSASVESLPASSKTAEPMEKLRSSEKNKKLARAKAAANKTVKNTKNDTVKIVKQNKRGKKAHSPSPVRSKSRSRSRSRSRSAKRISRSPSWPPSSPENWKSPHKRDTSPSVTSQQKTFDSSDDDKTIKSKSKHKHWKEVFKDKKNMSDSDKEPIKSKEISKHKDKNIKLKETIEKLKAKSELSLSDDGFFRAKNKDEKQKDKEVSKEKVEKGGKKLPANKNKAKNKEPIKGNKTTKCEYDFDEETKDSSISENKKPNKKAVKKAPAKNVADIEALTAATEQTLKDINKWLDDTPRYSEYSSASNSPSHFISAEEPDPIGSKIEQDFKKSLKIDKPIPRPKDGQKDMFKRRIMNKDPTKLHRRREIQRTIERLQPGKSKGNLLSNIQNSNKPEELFPLGPLSKLREAKNALVVKPSDTGPKLSLGSVLDSFGQQHNFSEDTEKIKEEEDVKDEITTVITDKSDITVETKKEEEVVKKDDDNKGTTVEKKEVKNENKATPNLSAWFKAFGAPKVSATQKKKTEAEEEKKEPVETPNQESSKPVVDTKPPSEESRKVVSPEPESPAGRATRQRRGSTGSSVSERSSFSQDLDSSPRMSIDERLGAYPAPYPSPLHRSPASASPVMASPRQEETQRPYPTLNGSIRVGFYQDTVSTKSSPDKSCSPRDQPQSPYQQYPEHVYTAPNTNTGFYSNPSYYNQNPAPSYANSPVYGERSNPPAYYDTNKPLTDQYNAKVPNTFQTEESANSPETEYKNPGTESQAYRQQIRVPEASKQTTMFPVKKRLYSENELANRIENTPNQEGQDPPIQDQDFTGNRNLEIGLMAGRQMNITSPTQPVQQPAPAVQEVRPASREQKQYLSTENRVESPNTFPRSDNNALNKPTYDAPQIEMQQDVSLLPTNQQINMPTAVRPMNFPTTASNVYNENTYTQPRQETDERKIDMSKLSNMSYFNPPTNVDMTRNPQYYGNRPPSRPDVNPQPQVSAQNTEHMNLPMRYPDSRVMQMGYRAPGIDIPRSDSQTSLPMTSMQGSEMLQVPQVTRSGNITNRMSQGVGIESYKTPDMVPRPTFSSSTTLGMDQLGLRGNLTNLSHIVDRYPTDERLLSSLQTSTPYYSDKALASSHMFAKGIPTTNTVTSSLPMFSQTNIGMSYGREMQQIATTLAYTRALTELQNPSLFSQAGKNMQQQSHTQTQLQQQQQQHHHHQQQQQQQQLQQQQQQQQVQQAEKKSRKRKTKQVATTVSNEPVMNTSSQQGFQSYAGLKNSVSGEPSAISLKTASVVPGSAFNFGPTPPGLGLSSGLYGDKDSYPGFLDEYRPTTNYYMAAAAAAHRATPDASGDKTAAAARNAHQQSPAAPTASFPFLGHPGPRAPGYSSLASPFMGPHAHQAPPPHLMDPNSPLYQQYLHSASVGVLHQGLLGAPAGYPPGYHPALSMRQPYDSMTRPSWL